MKYKCLEPDCGRIFEGDRSTMSCPFYGSENIKKASAPMPKWLIYVLIALEKTMSTDCTFAQSTALTHCYSNTHLVCDGTCLYSCQKLHTQNQQGPTLGK